MFDEPYKCFSDGQQEGEVLPRHPAGPDPHQLPVTDGTEGAGQVLRPVLPPAQVSVWCCTWSLFLCVLQVTGDP